MTKISEATFTVYKMGLTYASACTSLPDDEATARMNAEWPSGVASQWTIADEAFAGGEPNPSPCNTGDSNRHILFVC
jgi:hypothetical protein